MAAACAGESAPDPPWISLLGFAFFVRAFRGFGAGFMLWDAVFVSVGFTPISIGFEIASSDAELTDKIFELA